MKKLNFLLAFFLFFISTYVYAETINLVPIQVKTNIEFAENDLKDFLLSSLAKIENYEIVEYKLETNDEISSNLEKNDNSTAESNVEKTENEDPLKEKADTVFKENVFTWQEFILTEQKLPANYILVISVKDSLFGYLLQLEYYNSQTRKIEFIETENFYLAEEITFALTNLINKFLLFMTADLPRIENFIAQGTELGVTLNWQVTGQVDKFRIYRSFWAETGFEMIAEVLPMPEEKQVSSFADQSAEVGFCYYYKIVPVLAEEELLASTIVKMNRNLLIVNSESLRTIIKKKNRPKKLLKNKKDIQQNKIDLAIVEPYYLNSVKMRIMFKILNNYVKNGMVKVLTDYDEYLIDRQNDDVYFLKENKYLIKLHSHKLFKFIKSCDALGSEGEVLIDRVLRHSILYAVDAEQTELFLSDGSSVNVVYLDCIGITSEYYKDYKNWMSATMMFGTSTGELINQIKKAEKGEL